MALYTLARELDHKSVARIAATYGHFQQRATRLSKFRYRETEVNDLEEGRGA